MNANKSTERLVGDLKAVARDTEDLLRASAGEVSEKAREARARLTTNQRKPTPCTRPVTRNRTLMPVRVAGP